MHAAARKPDNLEQEILDLLPPDRKMTQAEYIRLSCQVEAWQRIEWVRGRIELLPYHTVLLHRVITGLFLSFYEFIKGKKLGQVFPKGVRTKVNRTTIRMPDIIFGKRGRRCTDYFYVGADLVMEVVDKGIESRKRDLEEKRQDYCEAGIPEYWIVDPERKQISVLALSGKKYKVHGEYKKGQRAVSVLLKGFEVDVTEALAGLKH